MARHDKRLKKGSLLGPYKIIRLIGEGGMGEVYEAHDEVLDRHVALKVISPKVLGVQEIIKRFMSEGQALARLNHQNVVMVYTLGEEEGTHYIAMEYVDGYSLHDLVHAKGFFSTEEALHHFMQLAEGTKALHQSGIIHRDLKPKNIIVRKDNSLKIVDFGIAKVEGQQDLDLTRTGGLVGSVFYLAPEVIDGGPATVQSDIWSLGCNFYEMLTGKKPFDGDRLLAVIDQVTRAEMQFPKNSKIPDPLKKIILKMCEKSPAKRYASVADVIKDIQAYRNGEVFMPLKEMSPEKVPSEPRHEDNSFSSKTATQKTISVVRAPEPNKLMPVYAVLILVVLFGGGYYLKNKTLPGFDSSEAETVVSAHLKVKSPDNQEKVWVGEKSGVEFVWDGLANENTYLEISRDINFTETVLQEKGPASPFVTKRLTEDGTYFWRLVEKQNGKVIPLSESVGFVVLTPLAPTLIFPVGNIVSPENQPVRFYWQEKSGATQYRFQIAYDSGFSRLYSEQMFMEPQTSEILLPPGNFYWRVRAEDTTNEMSNWSESRSIRVQKMLAQSPQEQFLSSPEPVSGAKGSPRIAAPSAPIAKSIQMQKLPPPVVDSSKPLALKSPQASQNVQRLTLQYQPGKNPRGPASSDDLVNPPLLNWSISPGATAYEVQVSKSPQFKNLEWSKTVSVAQVKWETAQPGKYFWRVRSLNGNSKSAFGSINQLELIAAQSRGKPEERVVENKPSDNLKITLVPSSPNGQKSQSKGPTVPPRKASVPIVVPPAPPARGISALPNGMNLPAPAKAKLPPNGVSIVSLSGSQDPISFRWESVNVAESYRLEISANEKFSSILHSEVTNENKMILTKPMPPGRIFWRVRSEKGAQKSNWSPTFHFEISK